MNKKKFLVSFSVLCVAAAFWACGDGAIESMDGSDDTALAMYGPITDGTMKLKVKEAVDACEADDACKAAMEGALYEPDPVAESSESQDPETPGGDLSSAAPGTDPVASSTSTGPVTPQTPTTPTSSATVTPTTPTSSATITPTSSATITPVSSSSVTPAAPGAVTGLCAGSPTTVEKGAQVTWKFTKLRGTIETYTWTLANASTATSTEATPVVTYATAGTQTAKVTINKGLESESQEYTCSVKVTGTPVTGCVCNASVNPSSKDLADANPVNITWEVTGCTGGTDFTYTWGGDATGTGELGQKAATKTGKYNATVTVTNNEGMTMSPTCGQVAVTNGGAETLAIGSSATAIAPGSYTVSCSGGGQLICASAAGIEQTFSLDGVDCIAKPQLGWGSCGSGTCKASMELTTDVAISCQGGW